ncbi:hypothetical protein AB0C59_23605 [Streptomyces sp. NPDC048664]|uniref:hypothetical protein n=1 Tax=Streptomyces sp. NPDC048664 TaxID=3154505 RepID=UPI00341CF1D0
MRNSLRRTGVVGCLAAMLCGAAAAPGTAASDHRVATTAVREAPRPGDLLARLGAEGVSSGGGSYGAGGVAAALRKDAGQARPTAAAAALPKCRGTFKHATADVTLQESMRYGIPWGVKLRPANSRFGVVNLSAQVFANSRQANVYQPHVEPWRYHFHGPLPRTFHIVRSNRTYTMPRGATVSFLWVWHSVARPSEGAYRYVNCTFKP